MKISMKALELYCSTDEVELWDMLTSEDEWDVDGGKYLYKDNGSNILAVAHTDTVFHPYEEQFRSHKSKKDRLVFSPSLDDRLGMFAIHELLPQMSITVDMLFTTGEESCASTAEQFCARCKKQYNWIVEFDRAGSDVVMYQYKDVPGLKQDLESVGFKVGVGSYSDISTMGELGVGAFNVGIGYHYQHTSQCFASIQELVDQLYLFKAFYDRFKDKAYTYDEPVYKLSEWDTFYGVEEPFWKDDAMVWNRASAVKTAPTGKRFMKRSKRKKSLLWENF